MKAIVTNRPVRADDEPFLKRLFATTEHERLPLSSLDESEVRRLLRFEYAGRERHYATTDCDKTDSLLLINDQPVGRMIILQNRHEIRLAELALLLEMRSQGLGTAMIQTLQIESRQSRRPLRVVVFKANRACNLYRRMGFYKVDETETHLLLEWTYERQREI